MALALARDVRAVEAALQSARTSLVDARTEVLRGEVDPARSALEDARDAVGRANQRTNRLLWRAAQRIPVAGRTLRTVAGIVDVADRTARLGREVVDGAAELLGPDGRVAVRAQEGRIPLAPLREAGAALDLLDTTEIRQSVDALREIPDGLVPGHVSRARHETIDLATEVADTIDGSRDLLLVIPRMLGEGGDRRYVVAMQNPAELRGTGGLVGFHATLEVSEGLMRLGRPESYEALEAAATPETHAVTDVDPVFAERYGPAGATSFFGSVNVDPDLPTTAPILTDLYEQRTGLDIDGVVLIDPVGLALLLQAVGPVDMPTDVAATAPGLPDPIEPEAIPAVTMVDLYEAFQGRGEARRAYLRTLATRAFESITDARWDGVAMSRQVATAVRTGHLAFHVDDGTAQDALGRLEAAGTLRPSNTSWDHLAVTANNAAGNKLDYHVGHQVTGTITLSGDAQLDHPVRHAELTVEVVNPMDPSGRAPYIVQSFPIFRPGVPREPSPGADGLARTWFSVWAPAATTDMQVDGARPRMWHIHEQAVVDHVVETPAGTTSGFTATATSAVQLEHVGTGRRYTLAYRRQARTGPDRLALQVVPPAGWRVAAVRVDGGADGSGSGPFGDAGPRVTARVEDGRVHLTGDASSDVVVVVDLAPVDGSWLDVLLGNR